jgi:hypothetical protein
MLGLFIDYVWLDDTIALWLLDRLLEDWFPSF